MRCWVIVPVKHLSAAKSRLAPKLSLRQRRELVCSLLTHTLEILGSEKHIEGMLVVGKDRAVRAIAANHGALFVQEKSNDGLNRALARGAREAARRGADSIMVLPADLPLLKKADITGVLKHTGSPPFLRIAPDRAGHGTNLLLTAPPGLIRFSFGENSFRRHVSAARRAGARVSEIRRATLANDLDCPEDLARLYRLGLLESTKRTKDTKKN
jgi:2-phospho-L-lactate/phosphoenolpyruvate guanylyltransferase